MENSSSWELNVPRENLKEALLKLIEGPSSNDYPTVSKWSCSFIRYEHYRFQGSFWTSQDNKDKFVMSFEDYFGYLEKSVYEQSWNIGKEGSIDFYDDNETTSILRISYVDTNTSRTKQLLLYFCGFAQPYWRTNLRLATFRLQQSNGCRGLLFNETIGSTLFILEALNVTFGAPNYGAYSIQSDWIREALALDKNHLSYDYLQMQVTEGGYRYYDNDVLILGNQLVEYMGIESLRKVRVFAQWERPNSLFLYSGPSNLYEFDGRFSRLALDFDSNYGAVLSKRLMTIHESPEISDYQNRYEIFSMVFDGQISKASPLDIKVKLTIEEEDY